MINHHRATAEVLKRAALAAPALLAPALGAEPSLLNVSCDAARESCGAFIRAFDRICAC